MKQMSIRAALNQAHQQIMAKDERIVLIGEDIVGGRGLEGQELGGAFGITAGLATEFGIARVIDTPISESAFVGMAVGAAMTGLKPIAEIMFCDFIGVCFDQLLNQAAKIRFLSNDRLEMPLVIRTTMGAGDGSGATHSQALHGLLASVPGLIVACPATPSDAAGLLKSAVAGPAPVILMEHKGLYDLEMKVDEGLPAVSLGAGTKVREGTDLTIVAISAMRHKAVDAAEKLAKQGISAEIIDPRTVAPLDTTLIQSSLQKTSRILVVDEGTQIGGVADSIAAFAARDCFADLKAAPAVVTPPQTPVPYGRKAEALWLPGVDYIVATAIGLMDQTGPGEMNER